MQEYETSMMCRRDLALKLLPDSWKYLEIRIFYSFANVSLKSAAIVFALKSRISPTRASRNMKLLYLSKLVEHPLESWLLTA